MKILVTGFNPFGGEKINPALEAVKLLPSEINGAEVRWVEIPTVFYKSSEVLEAEILRYQPDAVLCIGQAGGRTGLTPERVAINQDDARIPDTKAINQLIHRFVLMEHRPILVVYLSKRWYKLSKNRDFRQLYPIVQEPLFAII
ncbi:pyrrolidone-carboxylate peptidase [Streptococcus pneumoniae SP23-BS72]|nr:pyrrolidone-carboxylate peptidase [Streptococcus pneumoniae SP23-BS72]